MSAVNFTQNKWKKYLRNIKSVSICMRVQGLRVTESQWHHRSVKGLGQPNAPNFEVCLGKRSINISPLRQVKRPMAIVHLSSYLNV